MAKQNKGRKFFAASATAALVASAIVPVASAAQVNDYNKISGYAKEAVQALVDQGVIQGDTNGNFNPLNTVTRAQAAEIFTKALELEANGDVNFKDVKAGAWYYNSIAAVVANGIFEGVSATEFAPNKSLTRSEAAKILVEAFGLEGEADLSQFADASQVKPWAKKYLEIAVANGVFEGTDANKLNPNNSITRQDFALVFKRTVDKVEGETPEEAAFVKAINNTTVEVTFDEEVANVQALNFKIDGLEIKNASVKQTNKKVVVLTTASQTAEKEYVLTLDDEVIGGFKGIAAVVPTKVELVSSSIQGKLGQEVKLQAKVSVGEGQSKAGIPVTFNVPGDNNDAVVPTIVGEAVTNEEGIATYSYTRYKEGRDDVTAYATGDRSKFAYGYVFWGVDTILSIQEVTTGATVNNGANKTYKITYKNAKTGKPEANKVLNASVLENIDVTSDKLQNVSVNGVNVAQLSNGSITRAAQITTDSKGEATFTVSGTNAEATPVVYEANNTVVNNSTVYDYKYDASDLQATAAKVKFAAVQADYSIELTRDGGEVAAIGWANGRKYNVVVKDKDGKLAANEVVNVAINEDIDRVISTTSDAEFIKLNDDGDKVGYNGKKITVKTNSKGEASFYIGNEKEDTYGTPVAWIDINTSNAKEGQLDEGEPKAVGAISYFQSPVVDGAAIKVTDENNKKKSSFDGEGPAVFSVNLTNQSGEEYKLGSDESIKNVSYTVFNTGANDIKVGERIISPNRSYTFTNYGTGDLKVYSVDGKTTSVRVEAAGVARYYDKDAKTYKDFNFTAKESTAKFTAVNDITNPYTGVIDLANINKDKKEINFVGKKAIKYAGEEGKTYKYYGIGSTPITTAANFIEELEGYVGQTVRVTYEVKDDVVSFYIVSVGAGTGTGGADSTVVGKVNAATTPAQVQTALAGSNFFKALKATEKAAAITAVHTHVTGVGAYVSIDELNTELKTHSATTFGDINAVAAYTASVASVAEVKSTDSATLGTKTLTITSKKAGTAGNGYKVVIDGSDTANSTLDSKYDTATKTLTIKLGFDAAGNVSNTNKQVIDAIKAATDLDVTVTTDLAEASFATELATAGTTTLTTAGGTNAETVKPAELQLTFDQSVSATVGSTVTLNLENGGSTVALTGTVKEVKDEVLTLVLTNASKLTVSTTYTVKSISGVKAFTDSKFVLTTNVVTPAAL